MKNYIRWQESFRDKTKAQKIGYILYQTIRIAVLLFCTYELYLSITTGRPTSRLFLYFLLLTAPGGIYRLIALRNAQKGNAEALKKHDRMVWKSILLSIAIMTCVIVGTVIYAVYID